MPGATREFSGFRVGVSVVRCWRVGCMDPGAAKDDSLGVKENALHQGVLATPDLKAVGGLGYKAYSCKACGFGLLDI